MAATPRLNLVKPEGTDLASPITAMHEQFNIIDAKAGTTNISITEPVPSFIGEEWWQPVTKKFYIWSGTIWAEVNLTPAGPPPGPSGRKAFTVAANASDFGAVSSGESAAFLSTTFAAVNGTKYEITYCGTIVTNATAGVQGLVNLRIASGGSVTSAGTLLHKVPAGRNDDSGISTQPPPPCSLRGIWVASGTGSFTAGVFVRKESGFGSGTIAFKANVYHALAVEEVLQP